MWTTAFGIPLTTHTLTEDMVPGWRRDGKKKKQTEKEEVGG